MRSSSRPVRRCNTPAWTTNRSIPKGYSRVTAPLFPFGYGLSYTRFEYSGLRVRALRNGEAEVVFDLRNTGTRDGIEVAQVYVGAPYAGGVPIESRQLAGFQRLFLKAGQHKRVRLRITRRDLSSWSEDSHEWVPPEGDRPILVGSSSRDILLRGNLSDGRR